MEKPINLEKEEEEVESGGDDSHPKTSLIN